MNVAIFFTGYKATDYENNSTSLKSVPQYKPVQVIEAQCLCILRLFIFLFAKYR